MLLFVLLIFRSFSYICRDCLQLVRWVANEIEQRIHRLRVCLAKHFAAFLGNGVDDALVVQRPISILFFVIVARCKAGRRVGPRRSAALKVNDIMTDEIHGNPVERGIGSTASLLNVEGRFAERHLAATGRIVGPAAEKAERERIGRLKAAKGKQ